MWIRRWNEWPEQLHFVGPIGDSISPVILQAGTRHLIIVSSLTLLVLGMTFLDGYRARNDSFAQLFVPWFAWTIIFMVTAISLPIQMWRNKVEDEATFLSFNRDANIVICFLLSHLCSASSPGNSVWPWVLLPLAVMLARFLLMDNPPTSKMWITLTPATLFSSHCAITLHQPSFISLTLGLCVAFFLSQGFSFSEPVKDSSYQQLEMQADRSRTLLAYLFPRHATFLGRLRTIAFWLAVSLGICIQKLALSSTSLQLDWWKTLITVGLVECGMWFLICIMGCDSLLVATTLAFTASVQLLYLSRTHYLLAAEASVAIVLFTLNYVDMSLIRDRVLRNQSKILALTLLCFVLAISVMYVLPAPTPTEWTTPRHPIEDLIRTSKMQFSEKLGKQSRTLAEAVQEYETRTGIRPPPKFDVWFDFAQSNGVRMIDEYDIIQDLMRPFWGLPPSLIRERLREAIGAEDKPYMGILLRSGQVSNQTKDDWSGAVIRKMIQKFVHHLPDMDLLFNLNDEPSVVVPHDALNQLVLNGEKNRARSLQHGFPYNYFSQRPSDVVDEVPTHYGTNVLHIGRQNIWQQTIASCPLDSPARNLTGGKDSTQSYARTPLGFIYNTTSFSDVCNQPSLPYHHAFFDRPNVLQYLPTLSPVFSVAKVSTFNDFLFPSPWYYEERTSVDENSDPDWDVKENQMHWRGSTTGGYPANGGWRRHHRQRFVKALDKINNPVNVLRKVDGLWIEDMMSSSAAQMLFDVKFSGVSGDSTSEDQEAQRREFDIAPIEGQQDVWKWKHLLDVDGHGLSGRFYAMMKSKSLIYKCAMFREWHDEWLWPWVHYIPMSLEGTEWFENVRFFALEKSGQEEAKRIALESHEWAKSVLRKEDMETWMFRLLLELPPFYPRLIIRYARVVDDQRELLGFSL